jgi:hypothetical protein
MPDTETSPFRSLADLDIHSLLRCEAEREHRIPIVPCDSPIEDIFLWEFQKVAHHDIKVLRQQYCETRLGFFKLDFVLASCTTDRPKIGIECDGRNFHSETRDTQRDAAIIAAGSVDKIYRLRGRDIYFHIHDALHLLSQREPWLFSNRGEVLLEQLSAPKALREDVSGIMSPPGFPYGIMRSYLKASERRKLYDEYDDYDEYDEYNDYDESDEEPVSKLPTLICWTQRKRPS